MGTPTPPISTTGSDRTAGEVVVEAEVTVATAFPTGGIQLPGREPGSDPDVTENSSVANPPSVLPAACSSESVPAER